MKKLLVTFASATVIFLTGCQTPTGRNSAGTWRSSDFEDRTTDGWVGKYGTTLTITRDHATHSRWAMAAVLPGGSNYPGLYVPSAIGVKLLTDIAKKGCQELWVNPGAESPELMAQASQLGLNVIFACSYLDAATKN